MTESAQQAVFTPTGPMGVLTRELRIHVLNCSASGCLVESNMRMDIGTVGSLRLVLEGEEYEETVQVTRCQAVEGAGPLYHVGAKFLWMGVPAARSLRRIMWQPTVAPVDRGPR